MGHSKVWGGTFKSMRTLLSKREQVGRKIVNNIVVSDEDVLVLLFHVHGILNFTRNMDSLKRKTMVDNSIPTFIRS